MLRAIYRFMMQPLFRAEEDWLWVIFALFVVFVLLPYLIFRQGAGEKR